MNDSPQWFLTATSSVCTGAASPNMSRLEYEAHHSPPSSFEVESECICTSGLSTCHFLGEERFLPYLSKLLKIFDIFKKF